MKKRAINNPAYYEAETIEPSMINERIIETNQINDLLSNKNSDSIIVSEMNEHQLNEQKQVEDIIEAEVDAFDEDQKDPESKDSSPKVTNVNLFYHQ